MANAPKEKTRMKIGVFIRELYNKIKFGESFRMTHVVKACKVDSSIPALMLEMGYLSQQGRRSGAKYLWSTSAPTDEMAEKIHHAYMKRNAEETKRALERKVEARETKQPELTLLTPEEGTEALAQGAVEEVHQGATGPALEMSDFTSDSLFLKTDDFVRATETFFNSEPAESLLNTVRPQEGLEERWSEADAFAAQVARVPPYAESEVQKLENEVGVLHTGLKSMATILEGMSATVDRLRAQLEQMEFNQTAS